MCPGCVCLTIIIIIMIIIFCVVIWGNKSCFSAPEDGLNPWDVFGYRYDECSDIQNQPNLSSHCRLDKQWIFDAPLPGYMQGAVAPGKFLSNKY